MSNTYTKNFQDGQALTEAQLNTAFTTVKPTIANLALSTTGSSSFQVLRSTGSNTAPEYDDIGDILANGTMTAAGANAVINEVTTVSATTANLIGNAVNSSSAANNIINMVDSSVSSTGANNIVNAINSSVSSESANILIAKVNSSTAANAIIDNYTRSTGTTVSERGVAIANTSGLQTITNTSQTDITNQNITITSSGRPIFVGLFVSNGEINLTSSNPSNTLFGTISIYNVTDSSVVAAVTIGVRDTTTSSALDDYQVQAFTSFFGIDTPAAGTHTYKAQGSISFSNSSGTSLNIDDVKLIAYEL